VSRSICFVTPCYGGQATEPHFLSCLALRDHLDRAGIPHEWLTGRNESLVHRARMEHVRTFLASDLDLMFSIDADIEFSPDDVGKLYAMDADIAVGLYCMKRPDLPLSAWFNGKLVDIASCPKEPFPVDYAGTGFMCIKREVLVAVHEYLQKRYEKCADLLDDYRTLVNVGADGMKLLDAMLEQMSPSYEGQWGMVPALFQTPIHDGCLESEDYFFCRIAREAGFQVIADPSIRLGHWGLSRFGLPT
jgi:hypothetical protein